MASLGSGSSGRGQSGQNKHDEGSSEFLREPPRIPVFVFPANISFNGSQLKDQQRQILTIYNPYEFPIKFKVLSTSPEYYSVIHPEGSIKAKNSVDLIIRLTHSVPQDSPIPLDSKFRVQIQDFGTRQALGRKDVPSTIFFGQQQQQLHSLLGTGGRSEDLMSMSSNTTDGIGVGDDPRHLSESHAQGIDYYNSGLSKGRSQQLQQPPQQYVYQNPNQNNINYIAIVIGIICIIGLTLPNESELGNDSSSTQATTSNNNSNRSVMSILPTYLHLTLNQKLLIAYTLGLVTMVLFRP